MQEAKSVIRSRTLELVRGQQNDKLKRWSLELCEQLVSLVDNLLAQLKNQNQQIYIGGFSPLDDEVLWDKNFPYLSQLAYPAVDKEDMTFRVCHPNDLREKILFGRKFKEPTSEKMEVDPEILIIPGVAFTPKGKRLGRGKGFYDRYLKNFSGTRIGICYELQLSEELPTNERDEAVHYIVTEKRVIDCL